MIVIKVGGSAGIDYDAVCRDLAALHERRESFVLLHGGSAETNRLSEQLGRPPVFVTSASGQESRFTDRQTLEIFQMVYCGKMNKAIVEKLQSLGVNAVGLSGIDGRLLEGIRKESVTVVQDGKKKVLRGDFTGRVDKVNTGLIRVLLEAGYVPVICPPAISYRGEAINVDGDRAAARVAQALPADRLVILSNVPGLLRDLSDEISLVPKIKRDELDSYLGYAKGRMKKKMLAVREALDSGVQTVVLGDARIENPVLQALEGRGTVISR
jgi:acetylglutamate/LysW-gamma-L-alpha-aminoadipate kinase